MRRPALGYAMVLSAARIGAASLYRASSATATPQMNTSSSEISGDVPVAVPFEHDGAALGELLRRARERRGLTLRQIANETKIPERHLEALERGNAGPHLVGSTDAPRYAPMRKQSSSIGRSYWRTSGALWSDRPRA